MKRLCLSFLMIGLCSLPVLADEPMKVDVNLADYVKVSGVSGNISSVGSDTLNNLMALWSEGFRKAYPNVSVQVEGKGSGTAPPALVQGVAQLGPMSRPMKTEEIESFEKKMKFEPTAIGVALDALALYVHKDNPVESLTLEQIDAIFSKTRKGGYPSDIQTWGEIDPKLPNAGYPISIYGRNSASGTYGYFKKHALFKGDFKNKVKEQPGSSSVVMGITEDPAGIGYSGIGYRTSGVKTLKVSKKGSNHAVEPTADNVLNRSYPLGRLLLIYVAKKPNQPLPVVVEQFLRYVLSREGQEVVVKSGYIPLPAKLAQKQADLLK